MDDESLRLITTAMSNETLAAPATIKWLGGRDYRVTEAQDKPYRYKVETLDGSFKAHIKADDPMAMEIEAALEEAGHVL